jgi:hypothetical protein
MSEPAFVVTVELMDIPLGTVPIGSAMKVSVAVVAMK